jgi:probable rRNA maturation factor
MGKSALPRIHVRNLQRSVPVNAGAVEKFAERAMRLCVRIRRKETTELMRLGDVFVWLISDRRMARLHRQFLGKTGPTDVLTFQHGEIFISAETAKRHARRFGNPLMREIQLYIVHGLLHLNGFDDRTQSGARKMRRTEEKILSDCSGAL